MEKRIEARRFYEFLDKEVHARCKQRQADTNSIITDEDIDRIVESGAKTAKEKAFISLLHETGCRASEFLNLKVGDIKVKESYAEIEIPDGKTGKRVVYVTRAVPALLRYLDIHPFKNDNDSFLWLSESHSNLNAPLLHGGGKKLINRCFKRAGITKKHNWHWFRHSRATILAPKLTEVLLCKYMGWTIGSRQVKTYVHLSAKQLEDTFLALHGLKPREDETEKPIKCVCGTMNSSRERYCFKCYRPLRMETLIQEQELVDSQINKTIQFFMEMSKNPALMQEFQRFKDQQSK